MDGIPTSTPQRHSRRKPRLRFVVSCAFLGLAVIAIAARPVGTSVLRGAGWALVTDDTLAAAGAIVIAVDAGRAGVIEAGDLFRQGIAQRIAVFVDPPSAADRELTRRRVPVEDDFSRMARELRALGVERVERIPDVVTGSEDQGRVLPKWAAEQGLRSIVVVTGADHSRRLRRILSRATKGHQIRIMVRVARYSDFNPDVWWHTRGGLRSGLEELQKLLVDLVRHPIS